MAHTYLIKIGGQNLSAETRKSSQARKKNIIAHTENKVMTDEKRHRKKHVHTLACTGTPIRSRSKKNSAELMNIYTFAVAAAEYYTYIQYMRYKIERMYEKKKMPDPKNALASKSPSLVRRFDVSVPVSVCVLTLTCTVRTS